MKIECTKKNITIQISADEIVRIYTGIIDRTRKTIDKKAANPETAPDTAPEIESRIARIRRICREQKAAEFFKPGEKLTTRWNGKDIDFIFARVEPDKIHLQATRSVIDLEFDGGEKLATDGGSKNPDTDRQYGYNRWSESAVRQWLNSDAPAGKWWKPQNAWDWPPAKAETIPGFLAGLEDPEFLAAVQQTTVYTAISETSKGVREGTTDRFFLLSFTELFGEKNNGVKEGRKYDVKLKDIHPDEYWWMRSPRPDDACGIYVVYTSGALYNNVACHSYGVAPACIIGK